MKIKLILLCLSFLNIHLFAQSDLKIDRLEIENFYLGDYTNNVIPSSPIRHRYPDRVRDQDYILYKHDSTEILILNGRIANRQESALLLIMRDSLSYEECLNIRLPSEQFFSPELVIKNIKYDNGNYYLIGTINEKFLWVAKFDSTFNPIWSKNYSSIERHIIPEDLFIRENSIVVGAYENSSFDLMVDTCGECNLGFTLIAEINKANGQLASVKRFNDGSRGSYDNNRQILNLKYYFLKDRFGQLEIESDGQNYYIAAHRNYLSSQGVNFHFVSYALDSNFNIIWADTLSNDFLGTSITYYLADFKLNENNLLEYTVFNAFPGFTEIWTILKDLNGNIVSNSKKNFGHPPGTYNNSSSQSHKPFKYNKLDIGTKTFTGISTYFYLFDPLNGNTLILEGSNGITDQLSIDYNSTTFDHTNKQFVHGKEYSNKLDLLAVTATNFASKNKNSFHLYLDKYELNQQNFGNWGCNESQWPVQINNTIFPTINNFPVLIDTLPYNLVSVNQNVLIENISANEYQICGPFQDTCSELSVSIQQSPDTFCAFQSLSFNVVSRFAESYNWYINNVLVDSMSSLNYAFNSSGVFNIKVEVSASNNSLACIASDSIQIIINPLKNYFPKSDTTICKGDTIQIQASGAQTYQWTFDSALSCLNCPDPIVSTNDSIQFILTGTDSLGCTSADTFFLNIYPKPIANISGSNTLCPGVTDVWFGLNPLDSFIATWWIDTVGIITQDFGDSIYTTWPQGIDSAFVYAYVQYPAGCEGDTIRFKVKVNRALEPAILVADDSICFSDRENVTYNLSYNTNGSIYLWEIENGEILSGDSSSSIVLSWDSVGIGKLIVREYSTTNTDTCFGADSVFVEILPNPENDLMLIGKEDVCLGEDVEYTITAGWQNSSYGWIADSTSSLTGQGSTSITASWDSIGNYLVSAQEVSEYGCRGPKDSLNITVHPIPEPQRLGDDTLLCLDELGDQRYEVLGFINSTFNWTIEGGIIKSGNGTESINVTWDSTIVKSLSVQEVSEFSCESNALQIKQYFDLSRLELFVVSVSEDSSVTLDFELESLRSYPGDSIYIARRSEIPDASNWVRINRIPKTSTEFNDESINPNQSSYGYRVEGQNTCEQEIKSRDHASILLTGIRNPISAIRGNEKETIQLNWTAYRNWDGGVKSYELYEKFDSLYVKVAEASQTELTYDPRIPKKEHCFRIRALQNGEDRESWSNAFCIELERALNIPNVVTPNGDNKNDKLKIENLEAYPDHELSIYNRWGQEAFKSTQYNNNWPEDNTVSGTYFYRLRIKDNISGMEENYKGWVQILR